MKPEWKSFLSANGAEFDGGEEILNFGSRQRELSLALNASVFADLSHQGLLAVRGDDALTFLQAQLTNDLRGLAPTRSQLNGYCSPKGRLLASFRVLPDANGFLLRMPRAQLEPIRKRLQMFIMRAAVSVEDVSEHYVRLGVSGKLAAEELAAALPKLPEQINEVSSAADHMIVRIPGLQPRFELYGEYTFMRKLWERLNVRAAPVGCSAWDLLDIIAGIPTIYPQTADAFVPQMVNFQLLDGVSFKKGCYPGQEVVARMQYLGKLKRQMYLAKVPAKQQPQPGDELFGPQDDAQSVGKIVAAQPHPDGGYMVLAVLQIASHTEGNVRLGDAQGPQLVFVELPYSLDMPVAPAS